MEKWKIIQQLLDEYVKSNNTNYNTIARMCGLKRHQIMWIKDGVHVPKVDTFEKVLEALGKEIVIKDIKKK
jgi:predicted transcriptional regulator